MVEIAKISEPNAGWGICGVTSSLGALHRYSEKHSSNGNRKLNASKDSDIYTRVLAELKTFLVILKGQSNVAILNQIAEFTKSFDGFSTFTIDGYITKINNMGSHGDPDSWWDWLWWSPPDPKDSSYGIALSPDAVVEYLKLRCGLENSYHVIWDKPCDNVLVGLCKKGGASKPYSGLCHWVYMATPGEVYNWGRKVTWEELLKQSDWEAKYEVKCMK